MHADNYSKAGSYLDPALYLLFVRKRFQCIEPIPDHRYLDMDHIMTIPTPSFRRNRGVILILLSLLFFFVGFVKNVFAAWPGEVQVKRYCDWYNGYVTTTTWQYGPIYDMVAGTIHQEEMYQNGPGAFYGFNQQLAYCENDIWYIQTTYPDLRRIGSSGDGEKVSDCYALQVAPVGPCVKCEDEKAAKIIECGGADNFDAASWNDETCIGGQCLPITEQNQGQPCEPGQCCP